jgi:hypothetical protein
MAAVITDTFRRYIANILFNAVSDISDSNQFYVGIGKSDLYNDSDIVVNPIRSLREERLARANLQSIKKVSSVSMVVPRENWTQGTIFSSFSDSIEGIPENSYYILNELNEVYICLSQGKDATGTVIPSTIQPSYSAAGVSKIDVFRTADGYVWKYLYQLSAAKASAFLSANFMPVQKITGSPSDMDLFELDQYTVQQAAIAGQIIDVVVTEPGSGYTSRPTVTFVGDGSGANATAYIDSALGVVAKVELNNEDSALGSGYTFASIALSGGGGSGATARPVLGPVAGVGADARDDFKASSIMFNSKPNGEENGDFVIGNDFRQITLFRNIEEEDSDRILTETTANALRTIDIDRFAPDEFTIDNVLVGGTSGAKAFIDKLDSYSIYYHQNETTGFIQFLNAETVTESNGDGTAIVTSITSTNLADAFSGELFYIENRARIIRSAEQQEDIKIVITI